MKVECPHCSSFESSRKVAYGPQQCSCQTCEAPSSLRGGWKVHCGFTAKTWPTLIWLSTLSLYLAPASGKGLLEFLFLPYRGKKRLLAWHRCFNKEQDSCSVYGYQIKAVLLQKNSEMCVKWQGWDKSLWINHICYIEFNGRFPQKYNKWWTVGDKNKKHCFIIDRPTKLKAVWDFSLGSDRVGLEESSKHLSCILVL